MSATECAWVDLCTEMGVEMVVPVEESYPFESLTRMPHYCATVPSIESCAQQPSLELVHGRKNRAGCAVQPKAQL